MASIHRRVGDETDADTDMDGAWPLPTGRVELLGPEPEEAQSALQAAALAVLKRWDSPHWDWNHEGPTADLMADLRAALTSPRETGQEEARPVAAMLRSRHVTTWAHAAVDGVNHYSEWGEWLPTTYKHALAVTDPSRNTDPKLYEMAPLYAAPPARPVAPAGWKCVPVEPTQAFWDAVWKAVQADGFARGSASVVQIKHLLDIVHTAMLAASPAAPAPVALSEERVQRLKAAIEGECDGLAITDDHARAILAYVDEVRE